MRTAQFIYILIYGRLNLKTCLFNEKVIAKKKCQMIEARNELETKFT